MNDLKYGVGIDIALDKFDVCLSVIDSQQRVRVVGSSRFANQPAAFQAFVSWVQKHAKHPLPTVYVMEATGIYHENLAWYLFQEGLSVSVMLANRAKKYKEALGIKSKTDKIDAGGLSRLACEQHLAGYKPLSSNLYKMRMLSRQITCVAEQMTVVKNQLHALSHGMFRVREVEEMLGQQLAVLECQKAALKKLLEELVKDDSVLCKKFEDILAIKGVGLLCLAAVVGETNGFALVENLSQLTSYAGYDVVENQSGKTSGRTRISKKGNSHIRRALHFPALSVVRYDQGNFKSVYERIYHKTGIKMKGYVAVQRKLLCLIYTLWKKDERFRDKLADQKPCGEVEVGLSLASAL